MQTVTECLQKANQEQDKVALVSIACHSVETLNKFQLFDEAYNVISLAIPIVVNEPDILSIDELIYFLNETGNVLRYRGLRDDAIMAYEMVEQLIHSLPSSKDKDTKLSVVNRNLGIMYREKGDFKKAEVIFQRELKNDPDSYEMHHSLAIL